MTIAVSQDNPGYQAVAKVLREQFIYCGESVQYLLKDTACTCERVPVVRVQVVRVQVVRVQVVRIQVVRIQVVRIQVVRIQVVRIQVVRVHGSEQIKNNYTHQLRSDHQLITVSHQTQPVRTAQPHVLHQTNVFPE